MKLLTKIILIGALILVGPIYLLVSPKLTSAPKQVQMVQRSIQQQVPQTLKSVQSVPVSFFDKIFGSLEKIITTLSSIIGLLLGARELKKEKVKRRIAPKETIKKVAKKKGR